jgi:transcriptional regulator with XRE-family HTH domain
MFHHCDVADKIKAGIAPKKTKVQEWSRQSHSFGIDHLPLITQGFYIGMPMVQICPMSRTQTNQQKKEFAKLLYVKEGVTVQKELAERVGVSEQTISKWVNKENWQQFRASMIITKEEQLSRLYQQLTELNDYINNREPGKRFANTKEADTLSKLTSAIRQLETETSLADSIEVLKKFIIHIRQDDFVKAKEVTALADGFLKTLT